MPDDLGYSYLQRTVLELTGVDLACYQQNQMRRRLEALVTHVGSRDFAEYARLLQRDPECLQRFRDYFTINVSEFFRDPERYQFLQSTVLPQLLAKQPNLRVWSAGCSIGAEPFSVAVLLKEAAPHGSHRILATDVDRTVLARARAGGSYTRDELRSVDDRRLARFFTLDPAGQRYAVGAELRALVHFREHNLLGEPPEQGFDLILCRNVVIYFNETAKHVLYQRLARALRPDGVLFIGGAEVVPRPRQFGLAAVGPSFFRKVPPGAPHPPARPLLRQPVAAPRAAGARPLATWRG